MVTNHHCSYRILESVLSFKDIVETLSLTQIIVLFINRMGGIPSKKTNEFKTDTTTTIRGKNTFYDVIETDADNNTVSFAQYRGKVVYGVNVASACSQTVPGYALIKKLNIMDGVVILVFPSNQFLQETG